MSTYQLIALVVHGFRAVIFFFTLLAIRYYASETKTLRQATVTHNRILLQPFLWVTYHGHTAFKIHNIGREIARHVVLENIGITVDRKMIDRIEKFILRGQR